MRLHRLRTLTLAGLGLAVLVACVPVRDARYNDPYYGTYSGTYDPYSGSGYRSTVYSDGYYRASDGRVFPTLAQREYYQRRLNAAYHDNLRSRRDGARAIHRERRLERRLREEADLDREARRQRRLERRDGRLREDATRTADSRELRRLERERRRLERQLRRERRLRGEGRYEYEGNPRSNAPPPEGWRRSTHDGKPVWIDSEGRIRSGY